MSKQTNSTFAMNMLNIMLAIGLILINIFLALSQAERINAIVEEAFAVDINVSVLIIVLSVIITVISIVINYNIFKVLFKLSADVLTHQEILFVLLLSSILPHILLYVIRPMIELSEASRTTSVTVLYSLLFLIITNIFIYVKSRSQMMNKSMIGKLNLFLFIYGLLMIVLNLGGNISSVFT